MPDLNLPIVVVCLLTAFLIYSLWLISTHILTCRATSSAIKNKLHEISQAAADEIQILREEIEEISESQEELNHDQQERLIDKIKPHLALASRIEYTSAYLNYLHHKLKFQKSISSFTVLIFLAVVVLSFFVSNTYLSAAIILVATLPFFIIRPLVAKLGERLATISLILDVSQDEVLDQLSNITRGHE